ncbi:hypothetical protein [Roseibium sp. RKSG952]|uniref:hypothetical protein n=1 Tax=Roseibium sp. RKSG952 TaxID=2529384 RepID=UPI0012BB8453|nr:hypothetical protein [Roseibium sp. RKSG952]MTH95676.1 hypothetical protein [Roseibium sp. RKSG952]
MIITESSTTFIVKSLKKSIIFDEDETSAEMSFRTTNGRRFEVGALGGGKLFLTEISPTGVFYLGKDPGVYNPADFERWPRHEEFKDDPNGYADAIRGDGLDPDKMCGSGSGIGVHSKFFDTLEEVAQAIIISVNDNVRYCSTDLDLLNDEDYNQRLQKIAETEQKAFRESQRHLHRNSLKTEHGVFKGLHTMFGPLSDDAKKRILSFLNSPSNETWNAIHGLILKGGTTMWQAWIATDPQAPRSKPLDGEWPAIPDPDTIRSAMRKLAANTENDLEDTSEETSDDTVTPFRM